MPLICVTCGHANREGARFCAACGGSLAEPCGSCGAELAPGAQFCDSCGASVAGVAAEPIAETRKVVTVVFADLVGSTALQESLDPESVRRVMERFYEAMRAVLEAHGGSVQKFIGDAVVAVFGIPSVREDDALLAVRAAAAMLGALAELNLELDRKWGVRLQMRTGVNTGELVVSEQGVLVGNTMNTAARLEQAAPAGEVLIGEPTWRLVHRAVELEPVAPLELKGKVDQVRAWRLVSAAVTDRRRTSAIEVPLVGREAELGRLREAFDGVLATRTCRLVTIMGSPGVGKTRLAQEFGSTVSELASVVEGRCEPIGEGITFLPLAEVLRSVAGIGEADPAEIVRAKLLALTPVDDPDRERLVERIAGVLGVVEPSSAEETFWALRRGLEFLAGERPLVLVLDDLHWGQPMLLDLVEHLVEWVRDAPVLIVALARPELRETREALAWAGRRATDVLELEPLDQGASQELVNGLLGEVRVPAALGARILETTEGNPLFLGETVRMLIDEGFLRREGDAWVAAGDLETVEVPATIQALLAARIERLRVDERSVVERAAVIGKQFYRGAVAELVSPPVRAGIDGHLEALRRKDMVEPEGTYWIDEPVYRFHHVLIRDAAYRSLLKEARAELHERFADWLEVKAGDLVGEHEEVIAFHLEQAHEYRRQLGPPDEHGQALGVRAAERLHSAGRRALAREDLAAAVNLLGRALERGSPAESEILWALCEASLSAGSTSTAAGLVERFSGAAGDDPVSLARAGVLEAQLANLTGSGEVAATAESAAAAAVSLGELGDRAGEAKGWQVAAGAYVRLGQVGAVEEALDKALAAARAAEDRRRTTAVLAGAPRAALWGPSPVVRASGRCLDVVRILRMTPGNRHVEAIALRCQAVLEAMRGRTEAAREILAAGRATLEELGLAFELHETSVHAGIVELLAGDPAAAAQHLHAAREGFGALGAAAGAAQASALLARALVEQGGYDEEALEQTLFAEEHGGEDLKTTITWCSARAEVLARTGALDQALSFARRAVSLAEPTDALADKADASMALARVLLMAGQESEARQAARAAGVWYEAKGHAVGMEWVARLAGGAAGAEFDRPRDDAATGLGERPPERFWAEWVGRHAARDLEGLVELHSESVVMVDHRAVGWGDTRGREAVREQFRSVFVASPDVRAEVDEVLACDERVIALRVAYRGQGRQAGDFEYMFGEVAVIEDGLGVRADAYEYDDDAAMIARYAELGGGLAALGDRPPERWLTEFARLFAARRIEPLAELYAEDFELIDHRKLIGWGQTTGPGPNTDRVESMWAGSAHLHFEVDEVLACDDRVIALRCGLNGVASERGGGGKFSQRVCVVAVIESGRAVRWEQYEYDHREAALARYAELGGRRSTALGDRAPERVYAEFQRRFAVRDLDALLDLYAGDWVLVDRRGIGMEDLRGRDGARRLHESSFDVSPDIRFDIDEVLACDDRVIAMRAAYRGRGRDGVGEVEILTGFVSVVEAGLIASRDMYEYDDDDAMLRRYHALGGRPPALGDSPPEQLLAQVMRCQAAGDLDALMQFHSEDLTLTDHRSLPWEDARGRDALRRVYEAGFLTTPDLWMQVDEVLACDDRVIAHRFTLHGHTAEGGGEIALSVGSVNTVEAGRWATIELYDPDDREAMLARYAELTASVTQPQRPQAELLSDELVRRYGAHDLEALIALYDEHVSFVDHRKLGWEPVHGHAEVASFFRSGMEASADIRSEVDEVLASDDRVIAERLTVRGVGAIGEGEFSIPLGQVTSFDAGKALTVDFYEPDDRETMLRRYAELAEPPGAERPPERLFREYERRWADRNFDNLLELYAEDFLMRDHRPLGCGEVRGRDAKGEWVKGTMFGAPNVQLEMGDVIACDDRVIAFIFTWRGRGIKAGELEYTIGQVNVVENGHWTTGDVYDADDRQSMVVRYAELGGGQGPLGDKPPERYWAEQCRCWATMDVDSIAGLYGDDWVGVDHRRLGWEEMRGREAAREFVRSVVVTLAQLWVEVDDVLACDDRVIALTLRTRGFTAEGGLAEIGFGYVSVIEDGLMTRIERYEPDERAAMLARYGELRGDMQQLIAPDVLVRDRRGFPTSDSRGIEAYQALIGPGRRTKMLAEDGDLRLTRIDGDPPLVVVEALREGEVAEAIVLRDENRAREWLVALSLARRYAAAGADLDALMACHHPEGRMVDHRPLQLHEVADATALREFFTNSGKLLDAPRATLEVLDVYPGVELGVMTWTATDRATGGPVEWSSFGACRVRDGLLEEIHIFTDLEPALAKLEELSPSAAHSGIARRYVETVNARDWDALAKLFTDDCVFVEHRPVGWQGGEGAGGLIAVNRKTIELTADQALRVETIDDDGSGVLAIRQTSSGMWQGGPWETTSDCVIGLRDGLIARSEMFTPEQRDELDVRLAELRADRQGHPGGERWEAPLADDATLIDGRPGGWGAVHGVDAIGECLGRSLTGETLGRTDLAALLALEANLSAVAVLGRGDEVALVELFEDEASARERFSALAEDPDAASNTRLGIAWLQALNRRDLSTARACMTDDMVVVDHRPVPSFASELQTADGYLDRILSLWELSDDARWWLTDGIESAGSATNSTVLVAGHWNQGGGWAEIAFGMVTSRRGDRFERFEYYPLEALAERRARLLKLSSGDE